MCKNKQKIIDEKEFYNVKKAGDRLFWRLSPDSKGEYNYFKPNESDFKAFKSIAGMINRIKKNNVSNNVLFAKLYIYFLTQEIRHHETTIFNDAIQKELGNLLNKPLGVFYKAFASDLYSNQLTKLNLKNFNTVTLDAKRFKDTFTPELIESKLDEMINNSLLSLS